MHSTELDPRDATLLAPSPPSGERAGVRGPIVNPIDPDTGLTAEQLRAHEERVQLRAQANTTPLPGPLEDCFLPELVCAGGLSIRELVPYDLTILHKIGSPICKMLAGTPRPTGGEGQGEGASPAVEVTDDDCYVLIFLLTRPVLDSVALVRRGRDRFMEEAITHVACGKMNLVELKTLRDGAMRAVVRGIATQVGYQAAPARDGTVFTVPPAEPKTGSAGG